MDHSLPQKHASRLLKLIMSADSFLCSLFEELEKESPNPSALTIAWKESVNVIVNMPDRLANLFHRSVDEFFVFGCSFFV